MTVPHSFNTANTKLVGPLQLGTFDLLLSAFAVVMLAQSNYHTTTISCSLIPYYSRFFVLISHLFKYYCLNRWNYCLQKRTNDIILYSDTSRNDEENFVEKIMT